ncbi:MAG: hypothetical protein HY376_01080 [Candidatus Blackburnbacteria bacterium]|nr:hypothetical protein [Candidatus Blackburnbacteria bacterium]
MCVKDGNLVENAGIVASAREYQARMDKQADKTIQACVQGKINEPQAKAALARQFAADRKGFQKAIENLEKEMNSGRTVVSVGTRIGVGAVGRTLTVQYKDGSRQNFDITGRLTVNHGVIFDATLRDTLPHHGETDVAGPASNRYVGHSTNQYSDNYRGSWDNPGQRNFHWTNQDVPRGSDREAEHAPPGDAHKGNDPE